MSTECDIFSKPKTQRKTHRSSLAADQSTDGEVPADSTKTTSQSWRKSKILQSFFLRSEEAPGSERGDCIDVLTSSSATGIFDETNVEKEEENIPLLGPGLQWYKERGIHVASNMVRNEQRMKSSVIMEDNGSKGLLRGSATGTLNENIEMLMERLTEAGSIKRQEHLSAMISLATYIIENGLLVKTQNLAKKYKELKGLKESSRFESSRLLEIITKHLNVAQIYIRGTGYIIENRGADVNKMVESLNNITTMDQKIINEKVKQVIGGQYDNILQYLDSKRDRDVLSTILTQITSATFVANQLARVSDRRSIQQSKDLTMLNLQLFEQMANDLQEAEVDPENKLTTEVKRHKRYRLLQKMKLEKLHHIFKGRGRQLKCEEFPDLAAILEFAFGDGDRIDQADGGLESHPRLIDTVMYRAADNNTVMKQARETVLRLQQILL